MTDAKSTLFNMCVTKKWPRPLVIFDVAGNPHTPTWKARILLRIEGREYCEEATEGNKKQAENQACQAILNRIQPMMREDTPSVKVLGGGLRIWLIDLENKPAFHVTFPRDDRVIGFASSLCPSLERYRDWILTEGGNLDDLFQESYRIIITSEGGLRDLSDHVMSMTTLMVAKYLSDNPEHEEVTIKLISGDAAVWCTKVCMEKALRWYEVRGATIEVGTQFV